MGCFPLGKIVSRALGKRNGRERWREERMDYYATYPPGPPTETHYMRPGARTVTFSGTNSVYMIPPDPSPPHQEGPQSHHQAPPPQHEPEHHQPETPPPAPAPEQAAPEGEPKRPKRGKKKRPGRVRFGPDPPPPHHQQQQEQQTPPHQPPQQQPMHVPAPSNNGGYGPVPMPGPMPGPQGYFRYTPSPLPRWEATPRRHEYFSGEYRYSYPTPVREGIYRIATDANRLTTIFSEENPNACAIV